MILVDVLRAYPTGLGVQIHKCYQEALKLPAEAFLRFGIKVPKKPPSQIFHDMPIGDIWGEADLLPVFEYLYTCKYVRTDLVVHYNTGITNCNPPLKPTFC